MELCRRNWPWEWPEHLEDVQADGFMPRLAGHQLSWLGAIADGFGHSIFLIEVNGAANGLANGEGTRLGALPLVLVKGPVFGKFLVSLPYVNTGGVWATSSEATDALITEACNLADELDVKHLELRHETAFDHPRLNVERTDKVHMRLTLPETDEVFERSLKSKLRSQVKKANQYDLVTEFGGIDLLNDFYDVFCHNMRDLGTPPFSKKLFAGIINRFHGDAEFCIVRRNNQAIAGAVIVHRNGVTEVPSASCLRQHNRTNANMLMYRKLLQRAIEKQSHTFDFGRSSQGSGTYKFKAQWGAKPHPAVWQYYVRKGDPADMRPDSGGKQRLVQAWQRLPVWLTRLIGPSIVRGIP